MPTKRKPLPFAERLRSLRAAAALSQRDLAARAGIGQATVAHYERGSREPTFDAACRLADGLGVPVEKLRG